MEITEIIIETLLGILLIVFAYLIGCKGQIQLLHSYHYQNVSEEDKKPYTQKMGIGNAILGIGILTMPYLNLIYMPLGYYTVIPFIIVGIVWMIVYTIKYNGSLFGKNKIPICFLKRADGNFGFYAKRNFFDFCENLNNLAI